ncbi:MAG: cold-shock protein [Acidimicrobiales bacterium]
MLTGTVVDFDEHRGSGTVRSDDGRELAFHCTSLVDGSRVTDPGTAVVFAVVAGHHGRWEAAEITRLVTPSLPPSAP